MEDIDLGDRKGLISLVYGDPSASENKYQPITPPITNPSAHSSINSSVTKRQKNKKTEETRVEENRTNQKKDKKSGVACSSVLCTFLFLLALVSLVAAAVVAHLIALQHAEQMNPGGSKIQKLGQMKYNMSFDDEPEPEDVDSNGAAAVEVADEDRHIAPGLEPVWYKLAVKIFLPGRQSISPVDVEKSYEATLHIKLNVSEPTDRVELHSEGLIFDEKNLAQFKVLSEGKRRRMVREAEGNETMETAEEQAESTTTQEFFTEQEDATTMKTEETGTKAMMTEKNDEEQYAESDAKITGLIVDKNTLKVVFQLNKKLTPGSDVILRIPYTGPLRESPNGMYLAEYKNEKGEKKFVAMTHFEPQYARRFVPCFDEPKYKAEWHIEVTHPAETTASSNGVITHEKEDGSGWRTTTFKRTPPMSSYLLAIVVSEFRYNEQTSKSGKKVRLWSRPDRLNETTVAHDAAVKVLDYFEQYYDIPYPLEKQDIYALPRFEAGAMENWGLLMFREERLLYNPKVNTLSDKMKVLGTIAHELSHQWFGDLVTIAWWNDLWLNEGLARFYQVEGPDFTTNGELHSKDFSTFCNTEGALKADQKATSHPITYKVENPREIASLFDGITYDKGAGVTRMLREVLGEENFKKGIKNYLKTNEYKSSTSEDLFKSFDEVVPEELKAWDGEKLNVLTFASNWIVQMGFPVIQMRRTDENMVELTQNRFKMNNVTEENEEFRNARFWYKWDIPVWHSVDGETKEMQWLHEALRMPLNSSQLLLINEDSVGFYRVNYDGEGWKNIIDQLTNDHKKIKPMARARLISDAFALASAGQLSYETAFNLTSYMDSESDLLPWMAALNAYEEVLEYYRDRETGVNAREFIKKRVLPFYEKLDWDAVSSTMNKDFEKNELVSRVINFCCQWRFGDCDARAAKMYQNKFEDSCLKGNNTVRMVSECTDIPPTLRTAVYCAGVARAHPAMVKRLQAAIERETYHAEKALLVQSLGCARNTGVLKLILNDTLMNGNSAGVEFLSQFTFSLKKNPVADLVVQDYVVENWATIMKSLGEHQFSLPIVIRAMPVQSESRIQQLESFRASRKSTAKFAGTFDGLVETAKASEDWRKRHEEEMNRLFGRKKAAVIEQHVEEKEEGGEEEGEDDNSVDNE